MSVLQGYMCAAISVLFFGSNFSVVAKYDPGDGMFFQFALCVGIWCTGLVVLLLRGAPEFYPLALMGGAIWCTGNCLTVYIIKRIGLGPGLVTWGTSALIIGWVTGFFGLFGLPSDQENLRAPWLNVLGLGIAICALIESTFVKKSPPVQSLSSCAHTPSLQPASDEESQMATRYNDQSQIHNLSAASERTKGLLAALAAGCCYGLNFLPTSWIQHNVAGASQNGLDYVFNQFCGILVASTLYFLMYCTYMKNKPIIHAEIMLPGWLSGVMWGIAQSCWFVANAELGYSAAFPIILIGPGFIGSMWSVFLFKDIVGYTNYICLSGYFFLAVASCACIVTSRKT